MCMLQIGEISSATLRQTGSYSISNKRNYITSIWEKKIRWAYSQDIVNVGKKNKQFIHSN